MSGRTWYLHAQEAGLRRTSPGSTWTLDFWSLGLGNNNLLLVKPLAVVLCSVAQEGNPLY